ncbi:MAG: OB-fold domain-containing protein [Dehalococcoidales bacterium]|nr:OB-fold domain-containing protein [Dehalococcoidales bacterium]
MVGITSYGAYIPYNRLPRSVISAAWGGGGGKGEKAVAGIDEDPITMAVAAGIDCLKGTDPKTVDALFYATTTAPYSERLNSTIVATALDCRAETRNTDFGNCLRAGTSAILAAADAVKAGSLKSVLVASSDIRLAGANSENEQYVGDGAAALLIGDKDVAVEIEGTYTRSEDFVDYWRMNGDTNIRSWEDRFGIDMGFLKIPAEAAEAVLKKCNLTKKDISKVCFYAVSGRRHAELGKVMGFTPQQIQEPLLDAVGNTGTPLTLMILVSALEQAKAGDRILMVNWGNGSDAVVFKVTPQIEKIRNRRGIQKHLQIKKSMTNYGKYMLWRSLLAQPPSARSRSAGLSMPAEWREKHFGLPLYGVKCRKCGTVQLFMTNVSTRAHVCLECQAKDDFEPYRFADKNGKIVTFSHDFLGGGIDPPCTRAVVDFEGGGRGMFEMSDRDPNEIKVGMRVELTFRTRGLQGGTFNYFWKCKPVRD